MMTRASIRPINILIGILFCVRVDAQFNDTVHHYVNFVSTGSINSTSSGKTYLMNNSIRYSEKHQKFRFNTLANYTYGAQDKNLTNNDFTATVDGDLYHRNKRFFWWVLSNYTTSYSLKIVNQFQTGAGAAYSIYDTTYAWLNVSDGILYEKGDLFIDTLHDRYNTFRNSFRLLFKFRIKDMFIFEGQNYLQTSFADISDYIIKVNFLLTIQLKKWLGLTAGLTYNNFNRTNRENLFFNYGLRLEKYF